jgi:hypothetical protein
MGALKIFGVFILVIFAIPVLLGLLVSLIQPSRTSVSPTSTPAPSRTMFDSAAGRSNFAALVNTDPESPITFSVGGVDNEILQVHYTVSVTTPCPDFQSLSGILMNPKYKEHGFSKVSYLCKGTKKTVDLP